jgi:hypothetical protein
MTGGPKGRASAVKPAVVDVDVDVVVVVNGKDPFRTRSRWDVDVRLSGWPVGKRPSTSTTTTTFTTAFSNLRRGLDLARFSTMRRRAASVG